MNEKASRDFDLQDRLIDFAVRVMSVVEALPNNRIGNHVAGQLLRSGTAPAPNHGEAQSAESRKDFVHKMKIARKECREARYFLVRVANAELVPRSRLDSIIDEADQLVRILTAIIRNTGG